MSSTTTYRERQRLIYNEQTKLVANALDRTSTAVGVGSVFPLVGLVKPEPGEPVNVGVFVAAFFIFVFWAAMLRFAARRALGSLR